MDLDGRGHGVRVPHDPADRIAGTLGGEDADRNVHQAGEDILAEFIDGAVHDLLTDIVLIVLGDAADDRDHEHHGHDRRDGANPVLG
jgi:hypothetical protein